MLEADKITGTYTSTGPGDVWKLVFLEQGILETHINGEKHHEYHWKIVGEEIHIEANEGKGRVYVVNNDGSLTSIAYLEGEERIERAKDKQSTYTKI